MSITIVVKVEIQRVEGEPFRTATSIAEAVMAALPAVIWVVGSEHRVTSVDHE